MFMWWIVKRYQEAKKFLVFVLSQTTEHFWLCILNEDTYRKWVKLFYHLTFSSTHWQPYLEFSLSIYISFKMLLFLIQLKFFFSFLIENRLFSIYIIYTVYGFPSLFSSQSPTPQSLSSGSIPFLFD